jgi:hypothetical protein
MPGARVSTTRPRPSPCWRCSAAGVALWRRPLALAAIVAFLLIGNIVDSEMRPVRRCAASSGCTDTETADGDYRS